MAVLPLDHNPGISLIGCVVDGQDDHAAVVADDVSHFLTAARLDQPVAQHTEERPLEDHLGAEHLRRLLHRRLGNLRRLGFCGLCYFGFGGFFCLGLGGLCHFGFGGFCGLGFHGLCLLGRGGFHGFLRLGHLFSPRSAFLRNSDRVYAHYGPRAADFDSS